MRVASITVFVLLCAMWAVGAQRPRVDLAAMTQQMLGPKVGASKVIEIPAPTLDGGASGIGVLVKAVPHAAVVTRTTDQGDVQHGVMVPFSRRVDKWVVVQPLGQTGSVTLIDGNIDVGTPVLVEGHEGLYVNDPIRWQTPRRRPSKYPQDYK